MNRRGFIKAIPAVPFFSTAAKDAMVKELSGINAGGFDASNAPPTQPYPAQSGASANYSMDKLRLLLKHKEVLEAFKEQLRDDFRYVGRIDPDIAIKCWSMNVKVQHQRERNIEFAAKRWLDDELYEKQHSNVYDVLRRFATKYFLG